MRQLAFIIALLVTSTSMAQQAELLGQERWPDGTLRATRYQEGDRIHFITYHENGRVKEMGCFHRGRRDGAWKQYSDTGVLLTQANFHRGQRQGQWEFRDEADQVKGRLAYASDVLLRGEQYDAQGLLLAQRTYP